MLTADTDGEIDSGIFGLVAPHVPTLLEDERDGVASPIIESLRSIGMRLREEEIDCVLAATTHWLTDRFFVDASEHHRTIHDYYGFRVQLQYDAPGDPEFARELIRCGGEDLIFPEAARHGADHAVTIPLHFLFPDCDVPVIPLSVGGSPLEAFRWGRSIGRAIRMSGKRVLFLASGSLSHDLEAWIERSPDPVYGEFDRRVIDHLEGGAGMDLLDMEQTLIDRAKPEGAFRDLFMLLGVMGCSAKGGMMAYESLPGVGMGVIFFDRAVYREKGGDGMLNEVQRG